MAASMRLAGLRRTFVAPSPLTHSRPRAVGLTAAGRVLATVAVLLFAAAIGAGVGLYRVAERQAGDCRALLTDSVFVTGEVTRLWQSGDNRRRVAYRFVVDGRPYQSETRVSTDRRRMLRVGSALPVRYVAGDPRVNDLGGTPRGGLPMWLPFALAVVIAALGLLCVLILGQRRLLTDGRAAPAIVTAHSHHHSAHDSHRSMTFEFALLSGAVASGKRHTSKKPPAIGSVICILYHPDRPGRHMIYPLSLVRPLA